MAQYKTRDGDSVDEICWKHYDGQQSGAVEAVYEANPGLTKHGPKLPANIIIELPDLAREDLQQVVRLWD